MNKKRVSLLFCCSGSGVCSADLPHLTIEMIDPMSAATAPMRYRLFSWLRVLLWSQFLLLFSVQRSVRLRAPRLTSVVAKSRAKRRVIVIGASLCLTLLFSDQEEELSIWLFYFPKPFIRPLHCRHNISLVVNFDRVNKLAIGMNYLIQLTGRRPSA